MGLDLTVHAQKLRVPRKQSLNMIEYIILDIAIVLTVYSLWNAVRRRIRMCDIWILNLWDRLPGGMFESLSQTPNRKSLTLRSGGR
jgi:hypothetical protein